MRAVGPHSLARTGHAQVAADVSRRHLTNEPNAPTDGRVAQVPCELEGSARCRFPLLLWRRGPGRGGRRSPSACQIGAATRWNVAQTQHRAWCLLSPPLSSRGGEGAGPAPFGDLRMLAGRWDPTPCPRPGWATRPSLGAPLVRPQAAGQAVNHTGVGLIILDSPSHYDIRCYSATPFMK